MSSPSFKKTILEQNGHNILSYQSDDGTIGLDIIEESALIADLKLRGRSILIGPKSDEDLDSNPSFKSSYLLPFPNRLKEGKYSFEEKEYQFPVNDSVGNNALHGFKIKAPFKLVEETANGGLRLSFEQAYAGAEDYFPFPFKFSLVINIDRLKCEINMQVQNMGTGNMPIGLGWHPYFTLKQSIEDCQLCIPKCKKVALDDKLLPTGKKTLYNDFAKPKKIGKEKFNNAFLFEKDADFTSVTLENEDLKLRYYQETRDSKFNYLQVYTPDDRTSIAFEPMSCNIDAFNNKEGLRVLAPGKRFKARCGVALTKK